jgi:Uncharacterised nucleotidyltransferase
VDGTAPPAAARAVPVATLPALMGADAGTGWRDARGVSEPALLAARIAAYGLPGEPAELLGEAPTDDLWPAFVAHVMDGRVPGLLAEAVAGGALPVTAEQAGEVVAMHTSAMGFVAVLDDLLVDVAGRLDQDGIELRVLKGAAVARLDYPAPGRRVFGDVDLLVRGDDIERAIDVLHLGGFTRRIPELRAGFDRRFGKGAQLSRGFGLELDLHRTFADGPFGVSSRPDELFAAYDTIEVHGMQLRALTPVDRFVHACFHVALSGHLRLSSVRDVAQLALVTRPDVDAVHDRFCSWRAEPVLARAITRTWQILDLGAPSPWSDWAARFEYDRRARRALAASIGEGAGWPVKALEGVRAVPGAGSKVAYLRALAWPSSGFVASRGVRRGARWSRAVASARLWLWLGRRRRS